MKFVLSGLLIVSSILLHSGCEANIAGNSSEKSFFSDLKHPPKNHVRAKRQENKFSLADNLQGSHCTSAFDVSEKMVIQTTESIKAGAEYLEEKDIDRFEFCLKFCCETDMCNVAVWDERSGGCFLFDCGSPDNFYCVFDPNEYYITGAMEIDRHSFEKNAKSHKQRHDTSLKALSRSELEEEPKQECGQYEFQCHSGDCIPVYDTCNGIPQCRDGSDEEASVCPTTTAQPTIPSVNNKMQNVIPPPRPDVGTVPQRPQNAKNWGREGERYNPNAPQGGTSFQHQNSGIQLQQPQMAVPPQQTQGAWNGVGYEYGYPMNGYSGYQYGYPQQPIQPGYFPNKNNPAYGQGQGNQQQQSSGNVKTNKTTSNSTKKTKQKQRSKSKSKPITTVAPPSKQEEPSSSNKEVEPDTVWKVLIKDLKDEDFVMKTPSAAIFTLVVGMMLSILFAIFLICRIKALRRRGRKRNLASDSDGDYLVNGMYL